MSGELGLFIHVTVRRGTGVDAVLVAHGVSSIHNAYELEPDCEQALAMCRKELAAQQIVTVLEGRDERG